ncbi:MAG: hypothetical protein M1833_007147 [Piccolia ochrophora]|nr:MAG: hypothetical protein M1833_007147 [Piccolia ochrophora]
MGKSNPNISCDGCGRSVPYDQTVSAADADKENVKPGHSKAKSSPKNKTREPSPTDDRPNYLDIILEEKKGEMPCYESASMVRRKLNKLITDKVPVPGTSKPFSNKAIADQMREIKERHGVIKSANNGSGGPSTAAWNRFKAKSGPMGGGDSECYYFGWMLLEQMRIWKGEKKTKSRLNAEVEFPNGRYRIDPGTAKFYTSPTSRLTFEDVQNWKR